MLSRIPLWRIRIPAPRTEIAQPRSLSPRFSLPEAQVSGILVRTRREKTVGGGRKSHQAPEDCHAVDDRRHLVAKGADEFDKGVAISRRDFIGGVSTSVMLGSSSARIAAAVGNSTETAGMSTP